MKVMQAVAAIAGFITPILGFGLCGWFLIFRNRAVVEQERRKKRTFASKSWYPVCLRCLGIFFWLFAAYFAYSILSK